MAYIDKTFYDETFPGTTVPAEEFDRLADIASDVIYDVCILKPKEADLTDTTFKKAVAYQVEMLYEQGGVESIVGFSEASYAGSSERLGNYSVTEGNARRGAVIQSMGIPVSPMSIMLLRRIGLMARWAYAKR